MSRTKPESPAEDPVGEPAVEPVAPAEETAQQAATDPSGTGPYGGGDPKADPDGAAEEPPVEVRILRDEQGFTAGQLALLPLDQVSAAVAAGWADDHPDAVAYAKAQAAAE